MTIAGKEMVNKCQSYQLQMASFDLIVSKFSLNFFLKTLKNTLL